MYTRIDYIDGQERCAQFETLREAVREPPVSARSEITAPGMALDPRWVAGVDISGESLRWRPVSPNGNERDIINAAPTADTLLRARLADALGLDVDATDDELATAAKLAAMQASAFRQDAEQACDRMPDRPEGCDCEGCEALAAKRRGES